MRLQGAGNHPRRGGGGGGPGAPRPLLLLLLLLLLLGVVARVGGEYTELCAAQSFPFTTAVPMQYSLGVSAGSAALEITMSVPADHWAAIGFRADQPGASGLSSAMKTLDITSFNAAADEVRDYNPAESWGLPDASAATLTELASVSPDPNQPGNKIARFHRLLDNGVDYAIADGVQLNVATSRGVARLDGPQWRLLSHQTTDRFASYFTFDLCAELKDYLADDRGAATGSPPTGGGGGTPLPGPSAPSGGGATPLPAGAGGTGGGGGGDSTTPLPPALPGTTYAPLTGTPEDEQGSGGGGGGGMAGTFEPVLFTQRPRTRSTFAPAGGVPPMTLRPAPLRATGAPGSGGGGGAGGGGVGSTPSPSGSGANGGGGGPGSAGDSDEDDDSSRLAWWVPLAVGAVVICIAALCVAMRSERDEEDAFDNTYDSSRQRDTPGDDEMMPLAVAAAAPPPPTSYSPPRGGVASAMKKRTDTARTIDRESPRRKSTAVVDIHNTPRLATFEPLTSQTQAQPPAALHTARSFHQPTSPYASPSAFAASGSSVYPTASGDLADPGSPGLLTPNVYTHASGFGSPYARSGSVVGRGRGYRPNASRSRLMAHVPRTPTPNVDDDPAFV